MCDKRHLNDDNSDRDNSDRDNSDRDNNDRDNSDRDNNDRDNSDRNNNDDTNDNNNDDADNNINDNDDDVGASVDQAQAAVLGLQVPSLTPAQYRSLPPLHHFHLDANVAKALSRENAFKRF